MYYNDFPRMMEELSDGYMTQNSCLHGNANFRTILQMGVRPWVLVVVFVFTLG
jgi:hypothetical protein